MVDRKIGDLVVEKKVLRNSMDAISDMKTRIYILVVFALRKGDEVLDVHNRGHNRKGIQEVNLKSFDDITLGTFIVVIEN